jgi:hypothetical protein
MRSEHTARRPSRKPAPIRFTMADHLCAAGQRLRAQETACAATFALYYAARRVAAMPLITARRTR